MKKWMLLFSLLMSQVVGISTAQAFIVGGIPAESSDLDKGGRADSVVGIKVKHPRQGQGIPYGYCTGTLIASNIILTAAHCVVEDDGTILSDVRVFFKKTRIDNIAFPRGASVQKVFPHEGYVANRFDRKDDVALLLLSKPAPDKVELATLASSLPENFDTMEKFIFGYGISDDQVKASSDGMGILRSLMLPINGGIVLSYNGDEMGGMLLADGTKKGVCHADSGGPLFAKNATTNTVLQIGITESVIVDKKSPNTCSGPDYFVNVVDQYAWIQANIAILQSQSKK